METTPNLRTVIVEPGVDTNTFLNSDVLRALDQIKPKSSEKQEKEESFVPPKIIHPLQPINCIEGQPIHFMAKVEGNPLPTVRRLKIYFRITF